MMLFVVARPDSGQVLANLLRACARVSQEVSCFLESGSGFAGAIPILEKPKFCAVSRMNWFNSVADKNQFINPLIIAGLLQYRQNPQPDLQDQALY